MRTITVVRDRLPRKNIPERLRDRLSAQLGWVVALPTRTYAGKRRLANFCLSWSAREGIKDEVCSIYTMSECLKAERLEIVWQKSTFWWDVVPVNGCNQKD